MPLYTRCLCLANETGVASQSLESISVFSESGEREPTASGLLLLPVYNAGKLLLLLSLLSLTVSDNRSAPSLAHALLIIYYLLFVHQ
ncbi:uncharacterized protein YALI1_F06410g [Yarrowia lipolytica]|uniref:Uncharacterized protein n=1 Tax=Yarrowia lipolytica TaxID=4952 RepID=A0A1D8NM09_YARLL|nr:hypothetical protein YALI1_F06410g [Yarrowia lipolytica]